MRPVTFTSILLVLAACSEPDTRAIPVEVQWAEWPAEVLAATPFSVRLVGWGPGCYVTQELRVPVQVDQSAVTFEPYFLVEGGDRVVCLPRAAPQNVRFPPIDVGYYDTRVSVPGLAAAFPRTYEIRGAAQVYAAPAGARLPIRTFGEITVLSAQPDPSQVNAAGNVTAYRDSTGCTWISPGFFMFPGYPVENPPADTTTYWYSFVRGYLHPGSACGETRVFHLLTRN